MDVSDEDATDATGKEYGKGNISNASNGKGHCKDDRHRYKHYVFYKR
jgi:hypothetical protein